MKKVFLISFAFICFANSSFSQDIGYEKSIELGIGTGLDEYTKYSVDVSMVNGYKFNQHFYAGIGAGISYTKTLYAYTHYYNQAYDGYDGRFGIPLYARVKAYPIEADLLRYVWPFFRVDGGYTIELSKNKIKNTQGFMAELSFGVDFKLTQETPAYFMVGVNIQKLKYDYSYIGGPSGMYDKEEGKTINILTFKFGVRF